MFKLDDALITDHFSLALSQNDVTNCKNFQPFSTPSRLSYEKAKRHIFYIINIFRFIIFQENI